MTTRSTAAKHALGDLAPARVEPTARALRGARRPRRSVTLRQTRSPAIRRAVWLLVALGAGPTLGCGARSGAPATAEDAPPFGISTAAERDTFDGDAQYFTGGARIAMLFAPHGPRDFSAASVAFEPGARTAWHSHPAGQTLVVTEGAGWVQTEGGERRRIEPGDVVWTPPGVRHWHGATRSTAMTHLALQSAVDGQVVDWQAHVDDATYDGEGPSDAR